MRRSDPAIARPLIATFEEAERRIARELERAIDRGLSYTVAQRRAQLQAIHALLAETGRKGRAQAVAAIQTSYMTGALTGSLANPAISLRALAGIHRDAMSVLAANLDNYVRDALDFVGRRVDDTFRVAAVHEVATGIAAGQGRRTVSAALRRRLVSEAVTNATTGFVDAGGRRWSLSAYARMVARTTTREAVTRGTVNRLAELDFDLVTISSHADPCPICEPYDGETFSLSGRDREFGLLDEEPPFHPNCLHVLTPAAENLDRASVESGLAGALAV